jgi:hypothetical protein
MSPEAAAGARLRRLVAAVRADVEALQGRRERLGELLEAERTTWPARSWEAVAAVDLHGYYSGLESVLERVARGLEGGLPEGPQWHRDLLATASRPIPSIRPAVLSQVSFDWLEKLRAFRLFFRNAYAAELDAMELLGHAERLVVGHPRLMEDLEALCRFIEAMAASLATPDGEG